MTDLPDLRPKVWREGMGLVRLRVLFLVCHIGFVNIHDLSRRAMVSKIQSKVKHGIAIKSAVRTTRVDSLLFIAWQPQRASRDFFGCLAYGIHGVSHMAQIINLTDLVLELKRRNSLMVCCWS